MGANLKNRGGWQAIASTHESTTPLDFAPLLEALPRSASVLEVGCGYGRILTYCRQLGFSKVFGVDVSDAMLRRCQGANREAVAVAEASALPFRDSVFDCLISIATLSSISRKADRRIVLQEYARVLRQGGVLILRDFLITFSLPRLLRYARFALAGRELGNFVTGEGIEFHHFTRRELLHNRVVKRMLCTR